jgi:hypothetical protein
MMEQAITKQKGKRKMITNTVNAKIVSDRIKTVASLKGADWDGKSVPTTKQCRLAAAIAEKGWEYTDHAARAAVLDSVICRGNWSVIGILARDFWSVKDGVLSGTTCSGRTITSERPCPLPDMEVHQPGWKYIEEEEAQNAAKADTVIAIMPAMVPVTITGAADSEVFCAGLERKSAPWLAEVIKWSSLADKIRRDYRGTRLYAAFKRAGVPPEYWA